MAKLKIATVTVIVILVSVCYLMSDTLIGPKKTECQEDGSEDEFRILRKKNRRLRNELNRLKGERLHPSNQHERLRRKMELEVRELGYHVQSRMKSSVDRLTTVGGSFQNLNQTVIDKLNKRIDIVRGYVRTTISDLTSLTDLDREWREEKLRNLSKSIQNKIHQVMNPKNCQEKKKFYCDFAWDCGFGCEIHHVMHCLNTALFHGRPLVLVTDQSLYSRDGWEKTFKPISDTCQNVTLNGKLGTRIPNIHQSDSPNRKHLPLAIPEELVPELMYLHGNPAVWWLGQLMTYAWRFQPAVSQYINDVKTKIGFKTPIVGVHVRRTEKLIRWAKSHPIEEYMRYADDYFDELELKEKVDTRRVFLATDEPEVIEKAKQKYPQYEIISSLPGLVTDITLLAQSDFLVCTFSSNFGRAAYELMQAIHGDASQKVRSLDASYHYYAQNEHVVKAIEHHVPRDPKEIALYPRDKISLDFHSGFTDGYPKGRNKVSKKTGLFPSYKVEDTVEGIMYSVNFL